MSEDDDRGAVSVTLTRWGGDSATVGRKYFYIIVFHFFNPFFVFFAIAQQLLHTPLEEWGGGLIGRRGGCMHG